MFQNRDYFTTFRSSKARYKIVSEIFKIKDIQ